MNKCQLFFIVLVVVLLRSGIDIQGDHSDRVYLICPHWRKLLPSFCILVEKFRFSRLLTGNSSEQKKSLTVSSYIETLTSDGSTKSVTLAQKEIRLIQQEVFPMESCWFLPALDVLPWAIQNWSIPVERKIYQFWSLFVCFFWLWAYLFLSIYSISIVRRQSNSP